MWQVELPGLITPAIDGSVQATAINDLPARCKVAKWSSSSIGQEITVLCFDPTGSPYDTRFTLTYQYQRSLYGGFAPPPSTNFSYLLGPGANSLIPVATGLSVVVFPMQAKLPDDIQVTASGWNSNFCALSPIWNHSGSDTVVKYVVCFNNSGALADTGYTISDNTLA